MTAVAIGTEETPVQYLGISAMVSFECLRSRFHASNPNALWVSVPSPHIATLRAIHSYQQQEPLQNPSLVHLFNIKVIFRAFLAQWVMYARCDVHEPRN